MSDSVETVMGCIREVFRNKGLAPPALAPHTILDHRLGLRSLDYAELVIRLEEKFGWDPFAQGPNVTSITIEQLAQLYERPGRTGR